MCKCNHKQLHCLHSLARSLRATCCNIQPITNQGDEQHNHTQGNIQPLAIQQSSTTSSSSRSSSQEASTSLLDCRSLCHYHRVGCLWTLRGCHLCLLALVLGGQLQRDGSGWERERIVFDGRCLPLRFLGLQTARTPAPSSVHCTDTPYAPPRRRSCPARRPAAPRPSLPAGCT